jgi:deazaflavin-dependent oxidoreductase (nitroreductase family)
MTFDTPTGTRGTRSRGSRGAMGRWVQKKMMRQHRRKDWTFLGMDVLFLTTTGRKSGAERTTPVAWFPGRDGTWLIVASAAGSASNPAWYLNLAASPGSAEIEVKGQKIPVTAEQLAGSAREQAWQQIIKAQPRYAKYQQKTDRELPVILLAPRNG